MPKIVFLLKRLKGRIRKMGEQIFLVLGSALFPLGLFFEIEYPDLIELWLLFIIGAAVCWIIAYRLGEVREKAEWLERRAERKELREQRAELRALLVNIHKELQRQNKGKEWTK